MRLKCFACESLARPAQACAAVSTHRVEVELVPRRLHRPAEIRARLQAAIDAADGYDAVLLAFGLCGQTTAGLLARSVPLVLPRAHDCITLYLGSRARYESELAKEPATYWYAQDYMQNNSGETAALAMGAGTDEDLQTLYEHYIRKYGRPKADRLMAIMDEWRARYKRAVYLDSGLSDSGDFEAQARAEAERRGWAFERLSADLDLLQRLMNAEWDQDFLIVPPGQAVAQSYDERIIEAREKPE